MSFARGFLGGLSQGRGIRAERRRERQEDAAAEMAKQQAEAVAKILKQDSSKAQAQNAGRQAGLQLTRGMLAVAELPKGATKQAQSQELFQSMQNAGLKPPTPSLQALLSKEDPEVAVPAINAINAQIVDNNMGMEEIKQIFADPQQSAQAVNRAYKAGQASRVKKPQRIPPLQRKINSEKTKIANLDRTIKELQFESARYPGGSPSAEKALEHYVAQRERIQKGLDVLEGRQFKKSERIEEQEFEGTSGDTVRATLNDKLIPNARKDREGRIVGPDNKEIIGAVEVSGPGQRVLSASEVFQRSGARQQGKDLAKTTKEVRTKATGAKKNDIDLDRMALALNRYAKTGNLAKLKLDARKFAQGFGVPFDEEITGETEVLAALGNLAALAVRNPESGLGLPGQTSNKDLDFLIASVPGLSRTAQGNLLLIKFAKRKNKMMRDLAVFQGEKIKEYRKENKTSVGLPPNLADDLSEFINEYEIFTESERSEISSMLSEGGELPTPQTQEEFDALPKGAEYIDPDDNLVYEK